jgi:hypothetical protein
VNKQKVLVLDVETSPLVAYVWETGEQNVTLKQIQQDWTILAWSAKWLDAPDSSIVYYDLRKNPTGSDLSILKPLWSLLDEADVILTQNGKKFDSRKINARFMLNGLKPPKPYTHIDTYLIVKKVASFTSNSLAYLTSKFCKKHKKTSHSKYGGWDLWIQCLDGNVDAWNEMKKYNIEDVLSTEELYKAIRAWAPEAMPKVFPLTDGVEKCGTCGYEGQMREGSPRHAKVGMYRQDSCPKCGSWQSKKIKKGENK